MTTEYHKKYYETHKEKMKAQARAKYQEKRAERLAQKREYTEENHEKILEYQRKYRQEKGEQLKEMEKSWPSRRPGNRTAQAKAWRQKNKERISVYQKNRNLLKQYGISLIQRDEMIASQGGVCDLCKKPFGENGKRPNVDHCHKTGKIRAIIHHNCNQILANAKDSTEVLQLGIQYLEKFFP